MFKSTSIHQSTGMHFVLVMVGIMMFGVLGLDVEAAERFDSHIRPMLEKYCVACHGGEKVKGKVDFTKITKAKDVDNQYELWESVGKRLASREMPPEDKPQPTDAERRLYQVWYQHRFIDSVKASPGVFKPRRLSVNEYRHTLRSLFGFDLENAVIEAEQTVTEHSLVVKILPTDPPGRSGFTNDTHGNPLTTHIWDQYSLLIDSALARFFSPKETKYLEAYCGPVGEKGMSVEQTRRFIREFVPRAIRRPATEKQLSAIVAAIDRSEDRIAALKTELKVVLMSPAFIYRGMLVKGEPGKQVPIDQHELAERMSYFLWSDMPDRQLFKLANDGKLADPKVIRSEIDRMIDSPKSRSLATIFASQWLALNEVGKGINNPPQAEAFRSQPIDFMHYLFTDDRPLLELVDSKTAFVSPFTVGFYGSDRGQMKPYRKQRGIEVEIVSNQRIALKETTERGGILTIPGILRMNNGPVQRGVWMLERILGEHLPDPPMDIGQVPKNARGQNLSFRQRFEMHRNNKTCAVCHDKIDPLGFAMQRYNSNGAYVHPRRSDQDKGKDGVIGDGIDTSGRLPSGETFEDFQELKRILVTTQRETVIRNIVRRTMAYALCRKLEVYDRPAVEKIVTKMKSGDGTYRAMIFEIVQSLPFREMVIAGEQR